MALAAGLSAAVRSAGYYWRLVATGYNFAVFGLGGLLTAVCVMPLVRLWPGSRAQRDRRGRQAVHYLMRLFCWQMRVTGVITLMVADVERLRAASGGRVVVVNHPSLIDVVLVIAQLPRSCCVVKEEMWNNPLVGGVVRAAGYLNNAADSRVLLERSAAVLAAGDPIVVFPEGTRTRAGQSLTFQRGAANMAVRNGVEVLPVVIRCEPPTLRKYEPWYRIPCRRPCFTLTAFEPVDPMTDVAGAGVAGDIEPVLATRRLNHYLETFYNQELQA